MSAVHDLVDDPINFLNNNIVIVGFEAFGSKHISQPGGVEFLTLLTIDTSKVIGLQTGKKLPVYKLLPSKTRKNSFKSYWCPYQREDTLGITVSNKADFMFSAEMNGCSFGVGSEGKGGSRLVYHSNMGSSAPKGMQAETQGQALKDKMGNSLQSIIAPKNYRIEAGQSYLSSTTFGVRNKKNGKWTFYAHVYEMREASYSNPPVILNPKKCFLRGVRKLVG
jgi:hypothetical protein